MYRRAEIRNRHTVLFRNVRQARRAVIFFNLPQRRHHKCAVIALVFARRQLIRAVQKLQKQQRHRVLRNASAVFRVVHKRPNEVFNEILHRQHIRNSKQ